MNGRELLDRVDRLEGNVLELERDRVDAPRECPQRVKIVVGGGDLDVGNLPGGESSAGENVWTRYPIRRAAMANMRPSCPLPSTPSVAPGPSARVTVVVPA
jgi:hypothetical protein